MVRFVLRVSAKSESSNDALGSLEPGTRQTVSGRLSKAAAHGIRWKVDLLSSGAMLIGSFAMARERN